MKKKQVHIYLNDNIHAHVKEVAGILRKPVARVISEIVSANISSYKDKEIKAYSKLLGSKS